MKIIKDNEELKSYIVDGVAKFNESIKCDFNICINADIKAINIKAYNIKAHDIDARDITAFNIKARDIKAHDIDALDIDAYNISYYSYCIAYESLECASIEGRRKNSIHKCLDSEIKIKKTEISLQGQTFNLSLQELNNLKEQLK